MGSNSKKARRKKEARLIMLMSAAGILLVTVVAICLIVLVIKTTGLDPVKPQENETTTAAVAAQTTSAVESVENTQAPIVEDTTAETIEITQPVETTTAESTAPPLTGDELLDAANLKAAMYDAGLDIPTVNYFYGLGGRDYTVTEARDVFRDIREIVRRGKEPEQFKYIGLRDRDADNSNEFRDFGGDDQMDIRQSGDGVRLSDK